MWVPLCHCDRPTLAPHLHFGDFFYGQANHQDLDCDQYHKIVKLRVLSKKLPQNGGKWQST